MPANFNKSASYYDQLSLLVYGKALVNAQLYLLQFVPPKASVLIVGGGTGWILEELTKLHPSGLRITYVEVAAKMMALAKKRNTGANEVIFINDAVENVLLPVQFDAAFTSFLFDNFIQPTLEKVFLHIHRQLKPVGIWLNCDFQLTGKWWQPILLKSMFVFFKLVCNIEASRLPEIEKQFEQHGYHPITQQTFFGDFIISALYKREIVGT